MEECPIFINFAIIITKYFGNKEKAEKIIKLIERNAFWVYNNIKRSGGGFVLTLQERVVQKVNGLSEDNLQFLLDMIERFMQPAVTEDKITTPKRIGIAKGQNLYDDEYDFDEMNPEIAKIFGGMG